MLYKAQDYAPANMLMTFDQLTAAGSTGSIKMLSDDNLYCYTNVVFQATIAAINTTVNLVIEGSLDDLNWFYLDEGDNYLTYTANGTHALQWEGTGEVNYVRFTFVSETGGTDATVDAVAKVFGQKGVSK